MHVHPLKNPKGKRVGTEREKRGKVRGLLCEKRKGD